MVDHLTRIGEPETWYPNSVNSLEDHLGCLIVATREMPSAITRPLVKNIAYNLQYLEFLDRVLDGLRLSSVLKAQNIKSFVVHGAAVVEAIMHYIVVSRGQQNLTKWKSCTSFKSNEYSVDSAVFMNRTEVFQEVTPIPEPMTFDQLCKKAETHKLLGADPSLYGQIQRLRKLRNKVHLHGVEDVSDTDYMNFGERQLELTRAVLHSLMTSTLFAGSTHNSRFDFLIG